MTYRFLFTIFIIAFACALALTPISMKLAVKLGIMDIPGDGRRMHNRSIPRFGGLAIYLSFMAAFIYFAGSYKSTPTVIIGGTLMFMLGAFDDKFKLTPTVKFLVQIAITSLMYVMGIRMQFVRLFFSEGLLRFGVAADFIFTVLWIVGITNSINLIDGIDGLAAGTVIINTLCMAYIIMHDDVSVARIVATIGLVAIAGACTGFLPFNFSPAKTFMGDGGALFLGFMIGVLSTLGKLKGSTAITMIIPISIIGLPIFDTLFAIIRRLVKRTSIVQADKQHLHHILMASGYGHRRAVIMLYGISAIMGVLAILISKGFWMEPLMLFGVVVLFIYVFLTDTTASTSQRYLADKAKNENKEEIGNEN